MRSIACGIFYKQSRIVYQILKGEVKVQRDETLALRKALHSCSTLRSVIVSSLGDYWRMAILSNEIIYVNYHMLYLFSKLKGEVKVQRDETLTLRKALHSCSALRSVIVSSLETVGEWLFYRMKLFRLNTTYYIYSEN